MRSGLFGPLALICSAVFLVLYIGSGATDVWFAWTVADPLTATTLGAGFGAAVVLLVLAALESSWANARVAALAAPLLAGGSLLAAAGHAPAESPGFVLFGISLGLWNIWKIGLWLALLLSVVTLPMQLTRRSEGDGDTRTAPMPAWARAVAGLEGAVLLAAGVLVFTRPDAVVSPWPVTALDLRQLGVWMVVIGALVLYCAIEGDLRRSAAAMAALVAFAGLALIGVLWRQPEWTTSAWVFVAVLLVLLGTGALGLLLLGLLRVVTPVLDAARVDGEIPAHSDHGFFGPDSVTWRVWSYPTSLTVGFQRAVVIEELDPALVAAVDATKAIRNRPRTRYDRTLRYFAMVAFAGTQGTMKAADVLVKVHSTGIGIEPGSGQPYDANDPHSQLWIHLTAWHSILCAYEKYGPGRLSPEDEARYWADCATAAELQTCDPADVPRDRDGVRAYFERMRPLLAGSAVARSTMDHLLHAEVMLPPLPKVYWPGALIATTALRVATIATMPRWMRDMAGIRQGRLLDVLVRPVMKISFRIARVSRWFQLGVLNLLSPSTVPVVAPILFAVPPETAETLTPAQARERYGYPKPAEAHLDLRARQRERVFGEHRAPSDTGLVESEGILGSR